MNDKKLNNKTLKLFRLLLITFLVILIFSNQAFSETKKKRLKMTKGRSLRSEQVSLSSTSFSDSLNGILISSADTDLYDPLTLMQLRDLKERAEPWWDPEDGADQDETQRVAEKAIAIQGSTSLLYLLKRSDLRNSYKDFARNFTKFTDYFRYSLQDTGEGLDFSRNKKGEELIEFSLKFSVNRGADPQIYLGESVRLRYDWAEQHTMLEYGINF